MKNNGIKTFNESFPHRVCINLDRRAQRWLRAQERFARHAIVVERFSAIDGKLLSPPAQFRFSAGAYGCLQSHLRVIEQARERRLPSIMVFEDDVVFHPEFDQRFPRFIEQMPDDWDMIYLGAGHMEAPLEVSDNVIRLQKSYSTYAYALRSTAYDAFLELARHEEFQVDAYYGKLQQQFNCYCFFPHLAWVEEGYSDTLDREMSHWDLKESLVTGGPEMDQTIGETALIIRHRGKGAAQNPCFLARHYSEKMPGLAILILEQGRRPTIRGRDLPPNCRYEFIKDANGFDGAEAFQTGVEIYGSEKEFFIFAGSDFYLEHWDVRAGLGLCSRYEFISPFQKVIELSREDTLKLVAQGERLDKLNLTPYAMKRKANLCSGWFMTSKSGLKEMKRWNKAGVRWESEMSKRVIASLRVYENPGWALRLSDQ
jgi:GR25 family glycosyltransferase involved in LPS biosynthesis